MNRGPLRALLGGILAFLLSLCVGFESIRVQGAAESRGECVVEVSSRRFLHEKNGDLPLPMASTTKILTAIILIEDRDLRENVVIPAEAEGVEGSSVYLKRGETYTVEELLYGLMLRSGNDCALALALHHSGSVRAFAQVMNERAALMGATDSFFRNPHGLPAEGHHTTARDLALIASYAMRNETFRTIVSTEFYAPRGYRNKNKMLRSFEGANGVKTGFTVNAGRCLVTSAERGGMTLLSVVLNSPEMYERTSELLESAFSDYRMELLFDPQKPIEGLVGKREFRYPLKEGEREKVSIRVEKTEPAPTEVGDFAGIVRISLENSLIFSQNLYIME